MIAQDFSFCCDTETNISMILILTGVVSKLTFRYYVWRKIKDCVAFCHLHANMDAQCWISDDILKHI